MTNDTMRERLQRWLDDGCTDNEVPLDDYGKEIVREVLAAALSEPDAALRAHYLHQWAREIREAEDQDTLLAIADDLDATSRARALLDGGKPGDGTPYINSVAKEAIRALLQRVETLETALENFETWAVIEQTEWSERNADRYWQMNRVLHELRTARAALTGAP